MVENRLWILNWEGLTVNNRMKNSNSDESQDQSAAAEREARARKLTDGAEHEQVVVESGSFKQTLGQHAGQGPGHNHIGFGFAAAPCSHRWCLVRTWRSN